MTPGIRRASVLYSGQGYTLRRHSLSLCRGVCPLPRVRACVRATGPVSSCQLKSVRCQLVSVRVPGGAPVSAKLSVRVSSSQSGGGSFLSDLDQILETQDLVVIDKRVPYIVLSALVSNPTDTHKHAYLEIGRAPTSEEAPSMPLVVFLIMSLPTIQLFLQVQIWRIKQPLNPQPNHATGPTKPTMSEQESGKHA